MARPRELDCIAIARVSVASLLCGSLLISPLCAAPSSSFGTVVFADRAHVGFIATSVGSTIFSGDALSTESKGSLQVRAGAARLLLTGDSYAMLTQEGASPAAKLIKGTATFSTANAKAFAVRVSSAVVRPASDQPTIGKVTVLSPKELTVKSVRGPLTVAVEDDVREIPEGMAYRVVLDPDASSPQGPRGAGGGKMGGPPIKAAKSKFIWYVIGVTGVITFFALDEVLESGDRPH